MAIRLGAKNLRQVAGQLCMAIRLGAKNLRQVAGQGGG